MVRIGNERCNCKFLETPYITSLLSHIHTHTHTPMNGLDEKLGNHDDDYHFEAEANSFFLSFVNLSFRSSSNALTKRNYQKVCLSRLYHRELTFQFKHFSFIFPTSSSSSCIRFLFQSRRSTCQQNCLECYYYSFLISSKSE